MPSGTAREAAVALGRELAALPQVCLRSDRASLYAQWDLPLDRRAARSRPSSASDALRAGGALDGAARFAGGAGRHGAPTD